MPAEPTRGLPISRPSIAADLEPLGVPPGAVVLVHASLSSIGWVVGGEQALLQALRDAIGAAGTLVMPTQSWQLCDPAYLNDPSIPRSRWQTIRDELPPYDLAATPTRTMGGR
jgi:aminoglycoside 3-N-acetyltransferase